MDKIIANKDKFVFEVDNYSGPTYTTNGTKCRGVSVDIRCNDDLEMYKMLKSVVSEIKEENVSVKLREPTNMPTMKLKDEYRDIDAKNKSKDKHRTEEALAALTKLRELGIDVSSVAIDRYVTPEEYKEMELDYHFAGLYIWCLSTTKVYQMMEENGILVESNSIRSKENRNIVILDE